MPFLQGVTHILIYFSNKYLCSFYHVSDLTLGLRDTGLYKRDKIPASRSRKHLVNKTDDIYSMLGSDKYEREN